MRQELRCYCHYQGLLKEQNFGILRKHAGLQDKLIAKQMSRLESMIGKAHTTLYVIVDKLLRGGGGGGGTLLPAS